MSQSIKGASITKGIFRELSILGIPVYVSGKQSRILLGDDATRTSSNEDLFFLDGIIPEDDSLVVAFELDQIRYSCSISRHAKHADAFAFPIELATDQRRQRARHDPGSLSNDLLLVEIRGVAWRLHGQIKNASATHFVIEIEVMSFPIEVNELVHMRGYRRNSQALETDGWISFIRLNADNNHEIVVQVGTPSQAVKKPRQLRQKPKELATIKIVWPDETGLILSAPLEDLGYAGFAIRRTDPLQELPPIGALCSVTDPKLTARLVWISDEKLGFDLRGNTRQTLQRWSTAVEQWTKRSLQSSPQTKQKSLLLSIMFKSGYLRGKKAKAFAEVENLAQIIPNSAETKLWLRRETSSISNSPDTHVAFMRLTDSSWMIQEIAQCTSQNNIGENIVTEAILNFYAQEQPFASLSTVLLSLFDMSSKFNQKFWLAESRLAHALVRASLVFETDVLQAQIKEYAYVKTNLNFKAPFIEEWRKDFTLLTSKFSENLLAALGLKYDSFDSTELRQYLTISGYSFRRNSRIILRDTSAIGVAICFGIPTMANLTATANHLWLLLEREADINEVLLEIRHNPDTQCLLFGVTQIVVVLNETPSKNIKPALPAAYKARAFTMVVVPILSIPRFLGVQNAKQ